MMRSRSAGAVVLTCGVLVGYCLAAAALAWASAGPFVALGAGGPADLEALVTVAAAAGAWLCLGWLGIGFAAALLAGLPGGAGRGGTWVSSRITPKVVRRLAEIALGLTVASAAGLAGGTPALAATGPESSSRVHTGVQGIVPAPATPGAFVDGSLDGGPVSAAEHDRTVADGLPSLDRPAGEPLPAPVEMPQAKRAAPEMAGYAPGAPVPLVTTVPRADGSQDAAEQAAAGQAAQHSADVVVRRGDSLWGIAARQLGADARPAAIAAQWPRWYAANRHVIGADPDVIHPGQRLRPPGHGSTEINQEGR